MASGKMYHDLRCPPPSVHSLFWGDVRPLPQDPGEAHPRARGVRKEATQDGRQVRPRPRRPLTGDSEDLRGPVRFDAETSLQSVVLAYAPNRRIRIRFFPASPTRTG